MRASSTALLIVSDQGLRITRRMAADRTYDILINGQPVWSVTPKRDARVVEGQVVFRWPRRLRSHLHGTATVQLREHVTGQLLGTADHAFGGDTTREARVVDARGNRLMLDKWGRLIRPLADEGDNRLNAVMEEVQKVLKVLREDAEVEPFICYGTLLGAVRDGKLIGHDNDIDVAYVSDHAHPVDVVREGFRVERALRRHGWVVRRGSGVRLNVRLRLDDGSLRCVDVFTAHWVEGILFIHSDTGFALPRTTILPLGSVELMGRRLPAPAQPEILLEATYGPRWRVPDPSFRYETPRWLRRRLVGWFGGLVTHRKYWDSFHGGKHQLVPDEPTEFARWVAAAFPSHRPLIDIGTGTGRDAFWFAREHGRDVTALDYSIASVKRGFELAEAQQLPVSFQLLNMYDTRAVLTRGALLSRAQTAPDLYARFTWHALDGPGQANLIRFASMALRRGGFLFLEFRTPRDRRRRHVFRHIRHYTRPRDVVAAIRASGGHIVHRSEGTGLAPFRDEDPYVCRLVAAWR